MKQIKLTEREVQILEAYRNLDDHGKFEAHVMLGRLEEQNRVIKKLDELAAALDMLREIFRKDAFKKG